MSACSRPLRIHSNGAVFLKCAPSNPAAELAQTRRVRTSASSAPSHSRAALLRHQATHGGVQWSIGTGESPSPRNSRLVSLPNRRRCFDRLAFKKTCPCVPSRAGVAQHGRQRTDPTRSLGGSFSGIARLSKGSTGFLARDRNPSRLGDQKRREMRTQANRAIKTSG